MIHQTSDGYLALPKGGTGDAVLVLHAWWGLNDDIRALCRRLAGEGFVAYAPDLYGGGAREWPLATTIAEAEVLRDALDADPGPAEAAVAAGVAFLSGVAPAGRGLSVIGFSLGAWYAYIAALSAPVVSRVVAFYGSGPGDPGASQAAYLGHYAADDDFEPAEEVAGLAEALRAGGRPVTFHTYPGTGHWFYEPSRPEFNAAAAELAWQRTVAFLRNG